MNENLIQPHKRLIPKELSKSQEIKEKRGLRTKVFDLGGGKKRLRASITPAHYQENGEWKEIDTTIGLNNKVQKAPYNLDIKNGKIGYIYESKQGGRVDVELDKIGNRPVNLQNANVRKEGNVLFWENVTPNLDLKLVAYPSKVEIFKLLKNEKVSKRFKWKVIETKEGICSYNPETGGVDDSGSGRESGRLEMKSNVKNVTETEKTREYDHIEEWTGRVSRKVDNKTRKRDWFNDPVYPIVIDASTTENISANNDDGTERGGSWSSVGDGNFLMGYYYGRNYYPGFRFQSVNVPQGAIITSAVFSVYANWYTLPGFQGTFYADDVNNASAWSGANAPSDITKTSASKNWNVAVENTYISTGFTSLVQEVISRTGWSSANAIRFGGLNVGASGAIQVSDYSGGNSATLDITYTAGGPTAISVTDTGSGADSVSILNQIGLTESGSGMDSVGLSVSTLLEDVGSGSDLVKVLADVALQDSGSSTETLNVLAKIALSDSSTSTEAIDILGKVAVSDSSNSQEALNVLAKISVADTSNSSEVIEVLAQVAVSDSSTSSEAIDILVNISLIDSGTASEVINVLVSAIIGDTGSATEAVDILAQVSLQDSSTATELVDIVQQNLVEIIDSGAGIEVMNILVKVAQSDTASSEEAIDILSKVDIIDTDITYNG